MDKTLEDPRWIRLLKLAYHPGSNPKRPLPGPLFDLSVVGLFIVVAMGYALT